MEEVVLVVEVVVVVDGRWGEGKGEDGGDCDYEEVVKEIIMDFDGPGSASSRGTNEDLGSNSDDNSVPPAWGPILILSESGSKLFSDNYQYLFLLLLHLISNLHSHQYLHSKWWFRQSGDFLQNELFRYHFRF